MLEMRLCCSSRRGESWAVLLQVQVQVQVRVRELPHWLWIRSSASWMSCVVVMAGAGGEGFVLLLGFGDFSRPFPPLLCWILVWVWVWRLLRSGMESFACVRDVKERCVSLCDRMRERRQKGERGGLSLFLLRVSFVFVRSESDLERKSGRELLAPL